MSHIHATTDAPTHACGTHLDDDRAANLAENPYAGQGPVLLDVGGDVGALVVHLAPSMEGAEVEIRVLDDQRHEHEHSPHDGHKHPPQNGDPHDHHAPHVAVVGRPVAGAVSYTAVFPGLVAGRYELRIQVDGSTVCVDVPGARVTEVTWPAS